MEQPGSSIQPSSVNGEHYSSADQASAITDQQNDNPTFNTTTDNGISPTSCRLTGSIPTIQSSLPSATSSSNSTQPQPISKIHSYTSLPGTRPNRILLHPILDLPLGINPDSYCNYGAGILMYTKTIPKPLASDNSIESAQSDAVDQYEPTPKRRRIAAESESGAERSWDQSGPHRRASENAADSVEVGGARNQPLAFDVGHPQRAFRRALLVQRFTPRQTTDDLILFLQALRPILHGHLETLLADHHGIKIWLSVQVTYRRILEEGHATGNFTTKSTVVNNEFELDQILDNLGEEVLLRNAHYLRNASPFAIESIDNAVLHASRFTPLAGGNYQELPAFLSNKKCIVNVKNQDNRCFGYSVLAQIHEVAKVRNRASSYNDFFDQHGLATLHYPVAPQDVPAIEEQLEININIFSFFDDEGKGRYPLYVSKKEHPRSIDLLYWNEHYALITSFERLMADITKSKVHK